ncbi:unnamed protein product [Camellia sinensis]
MAVNILNIYIPKSQVLDKIIWVKCKNGEYSVKSGYAVGSQCFNRLIDRGRTWADMHWKKLWCLKIPAKWIMFLWKLSHRIVPVNVAIRKRGVKVDSVCPGCKEYDETLEHMCFQCSLSKRVWFGSQLGLNFDIGQELREEDWIDFWFHNAPDECDIIEAIKILWGIWVHRNRAVFDNDIIDPLSTVQLISNLRVENFLDMNFKIMASKEIREDLHSFIMSNVVSWCVDLAYEVFLVDGAWYQETEKAAAE